MATTITIDLRQVARGLGISLRQVQAVVELLDEGNTVPFITRYRKDQTGGLNEEQIRQIQARLSKLRLLAERKQTILRSIESQGKLTEELQRQILAAGTLKRLEDLYLPFKPRKQTLATLARSRGLEQFAAEILSAHPLCADLDARAKDFISVERKVGSAAEALLGAGHILAEQFSENAQLRQGLREILQRTGKFVCCQAPTVAAPPGPTAARKAKDASQPAGSSEFAADERGQLQGVAVSAPAGPGGDISGDGPSAAARPTLHSQSQTDDESRKAKEHSQSGATAEAGKDSHDGQAVPTGENAQGCPGGAVLVVVGDGQAVPTGENAQERTTAVGYAISGSDMAGGGMSDGRQALLPFMAEGGSIGDSEELRASAAQAVVPTSVGDGDSAGSIERFGRASFQPECGGSGTPGKVAESCPMLFDELRSEQAAAETAQSDALGQSGKAGQCDPPTQSDQALHPGSGSAAAESGPASQFSQATQPDQTALVDQPVQPPSGSWPAAAGSATPVRQATGTAAVVARQAKASAVRLSKKELKKKRLEERRIKAFRDYFNYQEEIRKIPPHRLLAINRGERAGILKVKLEYDLPAMLQMLEEMLIPPAHPHADYLRGCARDALSRLILPSLEREVRRELTDRAEMHAVGVFAKNLRNLLLQPPVRDHRILAIDPGFKSGCKLVALDQFGNVLEHGVIYLVGKAERRRQAKEKLIDLVDRHQLTLIAIGNGTACRHTEDFVAQLLDGELKGRDIAYVIVNEAGASAYSTSRVGREELPQYDASVRGAVSIGRRLLDPLSELVKIDPASIGVGLYQHDVKAKHLRASLDEVVESCVNFVGVDANTASPSLLRYVSGLNQLTARRLYEYRREHGPFQSRQQLREVPGIGEATFVQAAGFLRITGGSNPLDATWIHPESYEVTAQLLAHLGFTAGDLTDKNRAAQLAERAAAVDRGALARQLGVGAHTLEDILSQLVRPGRDPREDFPQPVFKHGPMKLEDLVPGMELSGTVSNVVDFGAFVDIGMHDSGLVHVSHLSDRFVRDPHEVVAVGDIVRVWVLHVDKERRRVSLTMVKPGAERQRRSEQAQTTAGKQRDGKSPPARAVGQQAAPQGAPAEASAAAPTGQPVADTQPPPAAKGARSQSNRQRGGPAGRSAAASAEGEQAAGRQAARRRDRETKPPPRRSSERGTYKPKPKPKPVVRITEAMRAGKEPMRTFGELLQFYAEKQKQQSAAPQQTQQTQPPGPSGLQDQHPQEQNRTESTPEVAQRQPPVAENGSDLQKQTTVHSLPEPVPQQEPAAFQTVTAPDDAGRAAIDDAGQSAPAGEVPGVVCGHGASQRGALGAAGPESGEAASAG